MQKIFLYTVIIVSFLYAAASFSLTAGAPCAAERSCNFLNGFTEEFPEIKQAGLYTDFAFTHALLCLLQNSIMPVIINNNEENSFFFCYSSGTLCSQLIKEGMAAEVKKYNEGWYLLKKKDSMQ